MRGPKALEPSVSIGYSFLIPAFAGRVNSEKGFQEGGPVIGPDGR